MDCRQTGAVPGFAFFAIKGVVSLREHSAGGKQSALGVAQTDAIFLQTLVERTPQQNGNAKIPRETCANVLRAEVAMREKQAVNPRIFEFFQNFQAIFFAVEQPSPLISSISTKSIPSSFSRSAVRPRYLMASGALKMLRRVGAYPSLMCDMAESI